MSRNEPDVSDLRQWSLLKILHESSDSTDKKFSAFLRENDYPYDATQKPWGKYYTHIRNKNIQVVALEAGKRIEFIDLEISKLDGKGITVSTEISEIPSVNRMKFIDFLSGLSLEGKRKLIAILKDLTTNEKADIIEMLMST